MLPARLKYTRIKNICEQGYNVNSKDECAFTNLVLYLLLQYNKHLQVVDIFLIYGLIEDISRYILTNLT